jgi:ssDNA-binding Zn-finger/Zn-ribbon topoisomerase 1
MGTRGYKVYRYKRRYFAYYHVCDSYPDCYGVEVLRQIPRNVSKKRIEQRVRAIQEDLEAQYEDMKDSRSTD